MILIVDDKKENIYSLNMLLQLHSYEVDTALSGEEALKKILKKEYELIILDVQMPGMDGFEVAETVTGYSKTKNTPILFLSAANIDKRFIAKGYASGGVDYVTKPIDPDLLMLKVKTFCRLYAQTRELKLIQESLRAEVNTRKLAEKALQDANLLLEEKVNERTIDLLRINKALEVSNNDLQQFASIASHDLQEPLRKIVMFSKMIEEKFLKDTPQAEQYINKVVSAGHRMRHLINDLLDYSKLSVNPDYHETDLNRIINDTINDLEFSIQEKKAEFIIDKLPAIEVIPGQIRQAFQNLISNALKFSVKGRKPVIKIWGEIFSAQNATAGLETYTNHLRIYVQDNGIGFNEIYLHKIFSIFQRLHDPAYYEGNGIGLAIVKKIVEKHNGTLTACSKEGEGSTFIMVLPVKQIRSNKPGQV